MAEFNLIDEPWIPCIDLRGQLLEYGIRETLVKARELREVCDESPLVTVAIHRMLLAMLYRTFAGPADANQWKSLHQAGQFPPSGALNDYLTKRHNRFFLFDDTYPFMQVGGLDLNEYKDDGSVKKNKSEGLMRLASEAPDKGGRILFDHRVGTERPEYQPKQIVKMILAAQSYAGTGKASTGNIGTRKIEPKYCQFAPCVDGLILWLQGDNLFQTLMLNLVPCEIAAQDIPAWEDDSIIDSAISSWSTPVSFTGPVQRFAPLSRLIRTVDKKSMFFTDGLKTSADSDDPMKAYYRQSDAKPYVASKLLKHKAAWRDAHTLLAVGVRNRKPPATLNYVARMSEDGTISADTRYRGHVVGLATMQGKWLLWRHERMPIPAVLLSDMNLIERLGALLQNAEKVASELTSRIWRVARYFRVPADREPNRKEKEDIDKLVEELDPLTAYWARLEQHFFTLLENLPRDWDEAKGEWKPDDQQEATHTWRNHVKRQAERALEESILSLGTTARAIQAVARARTNFNDEDLKPPSQQAAKAEKKGGKRKK